MKKEDLVDELQKLEITEGDLLIIKIGSPDPTSPYHHVTADRFAQRRRIFNMLQIVTAYIVQTYIYVDILLGTD